ncbi:hypothetical protein IQ260_06045 [Leptolyngbya cf. ectocarpi LEGE 11479]|uniref:Uncharacterized protein n=1 Tax=Leptolyngbya cf. ectocarpi LEGE 11479 TaxID=1828722 RepID=A0A928ZTM2_LEPEC|nr:hypothetical protein [Leptolyngbya ectocarpi]MBE9066209.1 hypothetical protein [Leptolyngbya cf. ectocarpi LEGE 11479]
MKRYLFSTISFLIATTAITTVAHAAEIAEPTMHQRYIENLDIRNKKEEIKQPGLHQLRLDNMDTRNKADKLEALTSTTTFPENGVESLMDVS